MAISFRCGGRALAKALVPSLDAWTGQAPLAGQLHSGDVGWQLRLPDERIGDSFVEWSSSGSPVAAGLVDSGVLRIAVAPDCFGSEALADAVTATAAELAARRSATFVDAAEGTAVRTALLQRGWSAEPRPWILLYRELSTEDVRVYPDTRPMTSGADVAARVAVQRSAFSPGSTFTAELWERMARGPSYDPRFENVAWTADGLPAAAATGWFAGPGRCAILEPVGTHREHQRRGYGRRVNRAVMAALAGAEASAVRVRTPASNAAAVATYESCGLRQVAWTVALTAPRSPRTEQAPRRGRR